MSGFPLDVATPPAWVARVAEDPLALLADHAHCELKAAASAQGLLARPGDHEEFAPRLAELAIEEMQHFRRVVDLLFARGGRLGPTRKSPYADGLHSRAAATRRVALLDRFLISSLIEARSLERFHLLANHLQDAELAELYAELLPSEAAHRGLFVSFAKELFPGDAVTARLNELRALEGALVAELPFEHRMHSGWVNAANGE